MSACKVVSFETSETVSKAGAASKHKMTLGWDDLTTSLVRNMGMMPVGWKRSCINARLYVRGSQGPEYWTRSANIQSKLQNRLGVTPGRPGTFDAEVSSLYALDSKSPHRSLTLLHNDATALPFLTRTLARSRAMYAERAYVHHYERFAGADAAEMFEECFESLEEVVGAYEKFCGV
ncbi:hypothetical protein HK104_004591 [Borealophlyctis nickersoniae]|nr:hypothetical protein HK104_004591 [Borealophlyctis nickersoniae]